MGRQCSHHPFSPFLKPKTSRSLRTGCCTSGKINFCSHGEMPISQRNLRFANRNRAGEPLQNTGVTFPLQPICANVILAFSHVMYWVNTSYLNRTKFEDESPTAFCKQCYPDCWSFYYWTLKPLPELNYGQCIIDTVNSVTQESVKKIQYAESSDLHCYMIIPYISCMEA